MTQIAKLVSQISRSKSAWTWPTSANIEVTSFCNIDCIMCRRTSWPKSRSIGNMSLVQFESILDQIPTLRSSFLTGIGEPLINKAFLDMLRVSRERNVEPAFVTNGTIVRRQGLDKLLEMRRLASQIVVSLDSPDPEEFEKIRVRASFDEVVDGIRAFVEAGKGHSDLPPIRVNMVVMESTVTRMVEMVELCARLSVDTVTFTPVMEYRPDVNLWDEHNIQNSTTLEDEQRRAGEAGQRLGVRVISEVVAHTLWAPIVGCAAPWDSVSITFDGHVCPCCQMNDSDEISFGNLFEQPFAEIWNGAPYREFRGRFGYKRVPCECESVHCPVAEAIVAGRPSMMAGSGDNGSGFDAMRRA